MNKDAITAIIRSKELALARRDVDPFWVGLLSHGRVVAEVHLRPDSLTLSPFGLADLLNALNVAGETLVRDWLTRNHPEALAATPPPEADPA